MLWQNKTRQILFDKSRKSIQIQTKGISMQPLRVINYEWLEWSSVGENATLRLGTTLRLRIITLQLRWLSTYQKAVCQEQLFQLGHYSLSRHEHYKDFYVIAALSPTSFTLVYIYSSEFEFMLAVNLLQLNNKSTFLY